MKRKILITSIVSIAVILILFFPIPTGKYDDGGTCEYTALTYKIVKWNKFEIAVNTNGGMLDAKTYTNTTIFWFPDNFKTIDELWEIERQSN